MRCWEVQDAFGLDRMRLTERPEPEPGPGQVLVGVRATSLNYRDVLMVDGRYDPRLPLPFVPLSDGVGEVLAVGEDVEHVEVGQRVVAAFSPTWTGGAPDRDAVRLTRGGPVDGMLAERVVLDARAAVPVPAHLTDAEAATLPCAGLTAWSALTMGEVRAGDTVLVLGSGGVSIFALQLARLLGARVVATTSSEEKAARLKQLGAEAVFRYDEDPRWGRAVRRWSGDGVDHVIEVGGAGTLQQSLDAVRVGGTISLIGVVAGGKQELSIFPVFMKAVRVQGVFVGSRQQLEGLHRAVAQHRLRPVIDRVFPFTAAPEAFTHLAGGGHLGKVVISVGGSA